MSTMFSRFAMPILSAKFRIDSGVYPLLLRPAMVGILGSSHPVTTLLFTNSANRLLLTMVWLKFLLANSRCFGLNLLGSCTWSKNQSYNSLCGKNSRVQKECEIRSEERRVGK